MRVYILLFTISTSLNVRFSNWRFINSDTTKKKKSNALHNAIFSFQALKVTLLVLYIITKHVYHYLFSKRIRGFQISQDLHAFVYIYPWFWNGYKWCSINDWSGVNIIDVKSKIWLPYAFIDSNQYLFTFHPNEMVLFKWLWAK